VTATLPIVVSSETPWLPMTVVNRVFDPALGDYADVRRFDGTPYLGIALRNAMTVLLHRLDPDSREVYWVVFDQRLVDRYGYHHEAIVADGKASTLVAGRLSYQIAAKNAALAAGFAVRA
jgi:hypothetical protein